MTHYHFLGIGGSGLSAIARVLLEAGHTVSGCDQQRSPLAEGLQAAGAQIFLGHDPAHLAAGVEVVIRSSAVPVENPEVQAALQRGLPTLTRRDFLGKWMQDKIGMAVAGTHGKTTTTSMLAWVLYRLGADPTFIVGGVLQNLGVNARAGQGPHFVIEADEYDRMFLGLLPKIAIVTNVEHDHPDCYPTFADMMQAFAAFVALLPADGTLIACADDAGVRALLRQVSGAGPRVVAYTLSAEMMPMAHSRVLAHDLRPNARGGLSFVMTSDLQPAAQAGVQVDLQVPGEHNVRNALAALAAVMAADLPVEAAARALGEFTGAGRRFEVRGTFAGVTLVDDYAHHPTEIRATLQAARQRFPQARIWAVWQPHTYSRWRALASDFAQAFAAADRVLVTEVYAAREQEEGITGAVIAARIRHAAVSFVADNAQAAAFLQENLRPGDVVLVLSAGDAVDINAQLEKSLRAKEAA